MDRLPIPTRQGNRDYGESGTAWFYFTLPLTDEQVDLFCERNDLCEYNFGPGRPYGRKPIIRKSESKTLILHRYGLDV